MKILLIIYAVSWLIIFAIYIISRFKKDTLPDSNNESWFFYFLLIILSPLIVLALPYIFYHDVYSVKKKERSVAKKCKTHKETEQEPTAQIKHKKIYFPQMYNISFKNIPFTPEKEQVIYVENIFDEKANNFIRDKYDELELLFKVAGLEFVYLPLYYNMDVVKEKVQYYAPYLISQINAPETLRSSYLLDFMLHPENRPAILPSLLFSPKQRVDDWVFCAIEINDFVAHNADAIDIVTKVNNEISYLSRPIEFHIVRSSEDEVQPSSKVEEPDCSYEKKSSKQSLFSIFGTNLSKKTADDSEDDDILFRMGDDEEVSADFDDSPTILFRERYDYISPPKEFEEDVPVQEPAEEITKMLENLEKTVQRLRLRGVALGAIHEFIDKQEPLSPLVITEDLRLFLPLYNNIEIELSAQKKALFFLFLNHPEGIVLQHLEDYHNELMNYYKQTKKGTVTQTMEESIRHLEAYGNNQIHVIIARIREAFCMKFDERLARNYFISGEKGEPYKIPLAPEYVKWEE